MRALWMAAALAVAGSSMAVAQDRHAGWLRRPSLQDLMAVFPHAAIEQGVNGKAAIACTVTVQGALRDCHVISESPPKFGFGQAAIAITPQLLMKPAIKGGVPVEDEVRIPFEFPNPNPTTGSHLGAGSPLRGLTTKVYSKIPWLKAPSVADVQAAYPDKARQEKVGGRATFDCVIDGQGTLGNCETINEEPRGYGFAAAGRALVRRFQGPSSDGKGQSMRGSHTQVLVAFPADLASGAAPRIGKPEWAALPEVADFNAAFPTAAGKAGVLKARVVLDCAVGEGGVLTDCRPATEEPPGYGFGAAASSLSGKFRVSIWTAEGLPTVGGRVNVPIRYELDQAPQPAAKP